MRPAFRDQLDGLWSGLAELAQRQVVAIERASSAIQDGNGQLAELVITEHAGSEQLHADIETLATRILAQQQPVASDLRLVLSSLPAAAALLRMGGLAAHVAKTARMRSPEPAVPENLRDTVTAIGEAARDTATALVRAIATRDAEMAEQVEASDDGMDALHRQLFIRLLSPEWPHGIGSAVDAALLGRYYERFCDQAVGVSRRVRFILTGVREHGEPR